MDWLLDRRGKSVAQSAQRVVADMHRHIEKQNKKVKELESVITQFNRLFTESLESDLSRLEQRKKELAAEMDAVDAAIKDRKERIENMREEINRILAKNQTEFNSAGYDVSTGIAGIGAHTESRAGSGSGDELKMTVSETRAQALEEQYLEESEMLAAVKEIGRDLLFIVHRNNVNDIIVYSPSTNEAEPVSAYKLIDYNDKNSITELSTFETMMAYGAKLVANHDRDFPHIKELIIPAAVSERHAGQVAQLVGAVEIPLTPDVVIDIWKGPDHVCWATTSVNGTSFAVLERMFVTSEVKWGVPTVTQVDLFGRHPGKGFLLLESITESE